MNKRECNNYRKYYDNLVVIGSGIYTFVYKGREIETNELRAIKVIRLETLKNYIISANNGDPEIKLKEYKEYIDEYINECKIMKICSNINSVKYYEYFKNENEFVIIMELCDCNLLQFLMRSNKRFFIKEIYEIMKQLNNGLKIMRENKIIHKSLKLENILIKYEDNNKYIIKLTDYESNKRAKLLYNVKYQTYLEILKYRPPEILKEGKFNYKSNLWTIGIILFNLKFLKFPFSEGGILSLIDNIVDFNNNIIEKTGNEELDDLIKRCLEKDHEKRINWDEYFNHPFFSYFSNKINLIYYKKKEKDRYNRDNNIFGSKFVENNKNNIELKINGKKSEFVQKYELNYGENNIEIIIKNKITNFEHMFFDCISLKNIEGLKNLDVSKGNDFSYIFFGCISLTDIKGLENWNVSNGNNFSNMFSFCKSLSDIKVLENWNVSNGINFSKMFSFCNSLSDIKGLENWDVSKGNNFSEMFSGCTSLLDIKGLQNWNVSNGINFSCMFCGCNSLLDINGLKNWNISNENKFYGMFIGCESLSNTNRSEYIDVLNGNNFSYKFCGCKSLLDIKGLENRNVSNENTFSCILF